MLCFQLQWKSRLAPLAPERGEGTGVRGEDQPPALCIQRSSGFPARDPPGTVRVRGVFLTTEDTENTEAGQLW